DATITIEALTGSGNYEYSISGAATVAQTTLTSPFVYSTAIPGDYTITIYDTATPNSALCNRTFVVNVPARVEPVINTIISTDITCIGDNDGTITVTAIDNGTGPYTFEITSLDGTPVSIAPTSATNISAEFTGLAPTTTAAGYIVTITGDLATNNCTTNSASILIIEPTAVTVTINPLVDITQFACTIGTNTDNNASITVNTVSGGSGTYVRYVFINTDTATTVQDGANNTYVETNRIGGNYSITVYDDNGCIGTTTAIINAFDELLTPTITIDEAISCTNAGEDITINAFGSLTDSSTPAGLANYEFRLLPGAFGASNIFTDLPIGTHTFEVRNINTQCVVTISHTITDPNTFSVGTPVTTDVICVGTATGTATFTVTDATYAGTYSWEVFNDNGTPTNYADDTSVQTGTSASLSATGLIAGGYYVTFTQDGIPTCENREPFSIAEPTDALAAGTPVVTPITCVPGTDGVIEITNVSGGWGGYAYYVSTTANPDPNDVSNY
ncbi:MAG: SprB repeat-containing protein, partial [Paracoccaceae bacterium]